MTETPNSVFNIDNNLAIPLEDNDGPTTVSDEGDWCDGDENQLTVEPFCVADWEIGKIKCSFYYIDL